MAKTKIDIESMTVKQKVKLLKQLIDNLDIVIKANYGAEETLLSDDIEIAKPVEYRDNSYGQHPIGKDTVIIYTSITTG